MTFWPYWRCDGFWVFRRGFISLNEGRFPNLFISWGGRFGWAFYSAIAPGIKLRWRA